MFADSPRNVHSARGPRRHQLSSSAFSTSIDPPSSAPSSARSRHGARWDAPAHPVSLPPALVHRTHRQVQAQAAQERGMSAARNGKDVGTGEDVPPPNRCPPLAILAAPQLGHYTASLRLPHPPASLRAGDALTPRFDIDPCASSRVMDAIRDGVSSLCLSADTALSNFSDAESISRHNAEASRRQHLLQTMAATNDPDGVSASTTLQHVLSSLLAASGAPIGADVALLLKGVTPLIPSQLTACVDLLGSDANRSTSPQAQVAGVVASTRSPQSAHLASSASSTVHPPQKTAGMQGGDGGGPTSTTASAGNKGRPSSQPLSIAKALDVGGVGGGYLNHPGDELLDISDAQMHVQTVLTLTRNIITAPQPLLQPDSSINPPPPPPTPSPQLVMDAVRSASKQAVVHLHNAADAFRQQRLQIVELQEQLRKMNAVSVFSSVRMGTATPSASTRGILADGTATKSLNAPPPPTADDSEFLLLVALDAAHLLALELSTPQANALRNLFHRFITTTVQRTNGYVVKEDAIHGHVFVVSFPSAGEVLAFERCVQFFALYLPWKQVAASCGPLPTVSKEGYASALLQECRTDDIAALYSGAHDAIETLFPTTLDPMTVGGGEEPSDDDDDAAAIAQTSGSDKAPSVSPSPKSGAGGAQGKKSGVMPHDDVAALSRCIARMEDTFRSSVTREVHSSVAALEEAAAPMQKRHTTKLKKQLSTVHSTSFRIQQSTSKEPPMDGDVASRSELSDERGRTDAETNAAPAAVGAAHAAGIELIALSSGQLAASSIPTWVVRGPLLRCAIHYGCAAAEARRDRFAPTNPLLDVLSTLAARCRGGSTMLSDAALRKCRRHLSVMNGGLVVVDNGLDAQPRAQPGGHGLVVLHQQAMASRLCHELRQPIHYELQWPNLKTRYTLLQGPQHGSSTTAATRLVSTPSMSAAGYDVWWWMRSASRRNESYCNAAAVAGMPWADAMRSVASTSADTRDGPCSGGSGAPHSSPNRGKRSPPQQKDPPPRKSSLRGMTVTGADDSGGEQNPGSATRRRPSQLVAGATKQPLLAASNGGTGSRRKSSSANRDLAASGSGETMVERDTQTLDVASAPPLTRLVLEACQWMHAWIDGSLEEEALLQRLYDCCDTPVQRDAPPNWGALSTEAELHVERRQGMLFGEDEVAARAAIALEFAGMRDVLREVGLYRRRRSNASPSAAAAAAASSARRGLGGGPGGAGAATHPPVSYANVWLETKQQVVSNPTAALMGRRRSVSPLQREATARKSTSSPQPLRIKDPSPSLEAAAVPTLKINCEDVGDMSGLIAPEMGVTPPMQSAIGDDVEPEIAASFLPGPF